VTEKKPTASETLVNLRASLLRGAALGLVVSVVLCAVLFQRFGCSDPDRQACVDRGGRVLKVHGGRGGWICEESRP